MQLVVFMLHLGLFCVFMKHGFVLDNRKVDFVENWSIGRKSCSIVCVKFSVSRSWKQTLDIVTVVYLFISEYSLHRGTSIYLVIVNLNRFDCWGHEVCSVLQNVVILTIENALRNSHVESKFETILILPRHSGGRTQMTFETNDVILLSWLFRHWKK